MKKSIACIAALLAFGTTGAMAEEMAGPAVAIHHLQSTLSRLDRLLRRHQRRLHLGNSSVAFTANDPAALAGTCGGGGAPKGQCINSVDFRRDGAVAGGQFGFNWQVNSHWLVGAEADYRGRISTAR